LPLINSGVTGSDSLHFGYCNDSPEAIILTLVRLFVGITDYDWYRLNSSKPQIEEVNFWRPSPKAGFSALQYGDLYLFKLRSPRNFIVGGGFFTKFMHLPISLAWEAFGEGNGTRSLEELRSRIARLRHEPIGLHDDPNIGCILLDEPFFFDEADWIPVPEDFKPNTQQGKGYDISTEAGRRLWRQVGERLEGLQAQVINAGPATVAAAADARYGKPIEIRPRLGQGTFRLLVTDAYGRRCAMTSERTLPALEAAHIRPYAHGGVHNPTNGLLLRSDLHRLFDRGYITVDPDDRKVVVSRKIREEYENGRQYYALHGITIASPVDSFNVPSRMNLLYHSEQIFRN
jgi:putative restriction endonuclease